MRDPGRWAVLVIDLQTKYTAADSTYRVPDADGLIDSVGAFVASAREAGASIAWIARRPHPELGVGSRTERLFGADLESFHNEHMNAIDSRLRPRDGDIGVDKPRHSAFFATDLEAQLRRRGVEGVVITGVTTNVCCLATAFDAVARDFDVVVASDLTRSLPIRGFGTDGLSADQVQEATLRILGYGVGEVEPSARILAAWEGPGS